MSDRQNQARETLIGKRIAYATGKHGDKHTYTIRDIEGGNGKPWALHLEDSQGLIRPLPIMAHGVLKLAGQRGFYEGWIVLAEVS